MNYLSASNLFKTYKNRPVVNDVNIQVNCGEIVGLLGPNGAGKTTTFYMIVGLVPPDQGNVYLGNQDITKLPMHLRAKKGISYLPQDPSVFRKLTVEENVFAVLEELNVPKFEAMKKTRSLLRELNILHIKNAKAYVLSGGERRRVEISRALATSPRFILLDEPFSGIDPLAIADIKSIICHLKRKEIGVLLTDHNAREMLSIVDRTYIINQGNIIAAGLPEDILCNEQARKIYFGDNFTL